MLLLFLRPEGTPYIQGVRLQFTPALPAAVTLAVCMYSRTVSEALPTQHTWLSVAGMKTFLQVVQPSGADPTQQKRRFLAVMQLHTEKSLICVIMNLVVPPNKYLEGYRFDFSWEHRLFCCCCLFVCFAVVVCCF